MKENIKVFLDTGLQKRFIPLVFPVNYTPPSKTISLPNSLVEAIEVVEAYSEVISEEMKKQLLSNGNGGWKFATDYLRYRVGQKTWYLKGGASISLVGIWLMIETNTSGQNENRGSVKYDRGYFYQRNGLTEAEKTKITTAYQEKKSFGGGKSHYIDLSYNERITFDINKGKEDLGEISFEVSVLQPNGNICDVDLILDLGNTRTSGLLFDRQGKKTIDPDDFKKVFKILRIKPDPSSGEYDSLDDVDAGIVQSWIVLHELEHQQYLTKDDSKEPKLLEVEFDDVKVLEKEKGWLFKTIEHEVLGTVVQRIPQMFSQLSPVLLGDQAERKFNLPYAKAMISVGANLQQSSPKRYYWDDTKSTSWWNMLLNEWDPSYEEEIHNATSLPTLQGEMLRFTKHDGSILDLTKELSPVEQPTPYPEKPAYPKQSTLTWFLLHILERAYEQTNSSFVKGQDFIPHRLRKVLITYPSGWTNDEVSRYHERCLEAINIFTQTNIYNGINSDFKLEMVPKEQTPDEAVASQLPFVFSEIIRYPGQTASDWISLMGKCRNGIKSVRIMNFDIGGGTSDISIVEYTDDNASLNISQNIISTYLLFKDGEANAGDDLVKRIIEKIILGGLIKNRSAILELKKNIIEKFTLNFSNTQDSAIRCRVIRTCLIPLATYCLSNLGTGSDVVNFSPRDAGIIRYNWVEFLEFLSLSEDSIGEDQACFSFIPEEINELIEDQFSSLFRYCSKYAAVYDIDMIIFSGKPSELPYIKTMARHYIPLEDERIIFAKDFYAGHWYPFTDASGYIKDAKTVTVVGCALYYALSNGLISGWAIKSSSGIVERNEWGEYKRMRKKTLTNNSCFLDKNQDEVLVSILPNTIIARRHNKCSSPQPVYKFIHKANQSENIQVNVLIKRVTDNDAESLEIQAVNDSEEEAKNYVLKLWPCENTEGGDFWQEKGVFSDIDSDF